jgi:hypothetical protein
MRHRSLAMILVAVAASCSRTPLGSLETPEKLTVFSIDGRDNEGAGSRSRGHGVPPAVGEFHGYPILGSVEIADPGERQRIIAALKDGISRGDSQMTCYWPRHGLRAVENGKTVD